MQLTQSEKAKCQALLFPALNICRGIELNLQDHECNLYQGRAPEATRNLMKLMELLQLSESQLPKPTSR